MKYTAHNNNLIEEKIAQDIASIKEEIIREGKRWGIVSLILYGGFGRGEGSVVVDGDNIRPLNDYDFMAVSRHPLPAYRSFRRFIQGLDSRVSGYTIDVMIRPLWFMKRRHMSVFYYELKNSGKVLWGRDVLSLIPQIDANGIPLSDGICTLFNRLMSLMEAYGVDDKKLVIYQCNKAVLTCMEILLLKAKRYHWSYKERLSIFKSIFEKSFPELFRDMPGFIDMAERATQFKLIPDFSLYPPANSIGGGQDLWEKVAHLYFKIIEKMGKNGDCPKIYGTKFVESGLSLFFFRRRIAYMAAYEWLKAWVEKGPSDKVRRYLSYIDRVEYTDDFLVLKEKIISNWKKPSFIL